MIRCVNHVVVRSEVPFETLKPFYEDFGLVLSHETEDRLYYSGFEGRPYIFVVERGAPGVASVGYELESEAALHEASARFGAPIEELDTPWGGKRVLTMDPDSNRLELVWAIPPLEPIALPRPAVEFNDASGKRRKGRFPDIDAGPAPVLHLCHVVHNSPEPGSVIDWYVEKLGAYPSDVILNPEQGRHGAFLRFPQGATYVEHHNVAVFKGPNDNSAQHICFETLDLDALYMGNHYLAGRGYDAVWGPVRHRLGGAISDYWLDPSGLRLEHVTDGDVLNDDYPTQYSPVGVKALMQWGPILPGSFFD